MARKKKITLISSSLLLLFGIFIRVYLGIFVVKPMNMDSKGMTVIYWRHGTNFPFLCSADGLLLKDQGEVSVLGRAILLGQMAGFLSKKEIVRLPYNETLYVITLDGKKLDL